MYLKKIIASGFKSFADKTVIDLTNNITGIVGPNGSGKSNVVDAVRWVLGEQSVKSLRGEGTMSDVIFSGSKSRRAMNMASVTLIFDNADRYLNLDFSEVSIRRSVYQDGTNEYAINDERCRLKDVTDLLLDSGIAKESFNIISQGKVEEIISSKPTDRRVVFEEAASVLKYRKRKEEALRKLEKTHNNLERVNDIRKELEVQVEPLRKQKEAALIYQEKSEELKSSEISLLASDINTYNTKYQENKDKVEVLNEEIMSLSTSSTSDEAKIEEVKKEIVNLDLKINQTSKELLDITSKVEKASSKKTLLQERQKYEVSDSKLHDNMASLKEEQMRLNVEVSTIDNDINSLSKDIDTTNKKEEEKDLEYKKVGKEKEEALETLSDITKENITLTNMITTLQNSIENNSLLPNSIRSVLNNPKLKGIHNIIGNIIEVEEKYATAITTSLGYATNYVIVDNSSCAEAAINYLKENKLGRVTFFPLNVIEGKSIDDKIKANLDKYTGFVGIASTLVEYDSKYKNIIENQLDNVLVVDTLANANKISKELNYRIKIVTLDGELLHIGGSLTGGVNYHNKNVIEEKFELENLLKNKKANETKLASLEDKLNDYDYKLKSIEDEIYLINKKMVELNESLVQKSKRKEEVNIRLDEIDSELTGNKSILENTFSKEEEKAMQEYYDAVLEKETKEKELESVKNAKKEASASLEALEFSSRKENSLVSSKNKELKSLEIEINRLDVKLDTLLNNLSETYSMTYEYALENYPLLDDVDMVRSKVQTLKREIKELGTVNMLAIEEYDKVNERYTFLNEQENDLLKAEETLLEIIKEMDAVMEKEFAATFNVIKENFKETFKDLFHGGTADLKLTDPSNLLETGIEIVASPPGKTLKSISFLSGGEKTFTAISLLFAILKSRPVPYCILDEVEAALDEVNVDSFGEYLRTLKDKTQFILITHKKKTMEYADYLYGVTMQESGVSKLVSVKLEEVKDENNNDRK